MLIQYEKGTSVLHRWSPLSKLVMVICYAVTAMLWDRTWIQALLLAGCILAARLAGKLPWSKLLRGMKVIAIAAVPYFVMTLLTAKGKNVWLEWGIIRLTTEALDTAGGLSLRLVNLFLSSLIFIAVTHPLELVAQAVRQLRIPYRLAFGVSAALTFLPMLEEEGRSIREAQQVRGRRPPKGITERLLWWGQFTAAVVINCLRRVQHTAGAMESKGFGAYPERTFHKPQRTFHAGTAAALISAAITAVMVWMRTAL